MEQTTNKREGEKGMKEKLISIWNDLRKNEQKEIDDEITKLILGELDDLNYSVEHNTGITDNDAKTIRELNNIRLDNKKAKAEIAEKIAKIFGITVTTAATIVSIVLAVKYFKMDCTWLEILYKLKDSVDVVDRPTSNQANRFRDDHRKSNMNNISKGIRI